MTSNSPTNVPGYFDVYLKHVPEENVLLALQAQQPVLDRFIALMNPELAQYRYAENKWTIQTMWQHVNDTERIFGYRALAISRGEIQVLPSFDENQYADESFADERTWHSVWIEWQHLRASTFAMFAGFSEKHLQRQGKFSVHEASVQTLGRILVGHVYHHMEVLRQRYGLDV
jgi:hypothetical protein